MVGFVPMDYFEFQMDEKNPALSIVPIWFPLELSLIHISEPTRPY